MKYILFALISFLFMNCGLSSVDNNSTSEAVFQTNLVAEKSASQKIAGEIIKNQRSRIQDSWGKGQFKAPRGKLKHEGLDIAAAIGEKIYAPFDGIIVRKAIPYAKDPRFEGLLMKGSGEWEGYEIKIFYVVGLLSGGVTKGQEIGIVQDLTQKYPKITNHIHVEVKVSGALLNPLELWQMSF